MDDASFRERHTVMKIRMSSVSYVLGAEKLKVDHQQSRSSSLPTFQVIILHLVFSFPISASSVSCIVCILAQDTNALLS